MEVRTEFAIYHRGEAIRVKEAEEVETQDTWVDDKVDPPRRGEIEETIVAEPPTTRTPYWTVKMFRASTEVN